MTRILTIEVAAPSPNGHLMLQDSELSITHRYAVDLHAVDCSGFALLTDSEKVSSDAAFAEAISGKTLDDHPASGLDALRASLA
jgi:hypothetical protein